MIRFNANQQKTLLANARAKFYAENNISVNNGSDINATWTAEEFIKTFPLYEISYKTSLGDQKQGVYIIRDAKSPDVRTYITLSTQLKEVANDDFDEGFTIKDLGNLHKNHGILFYEMRNEDGILFIVAGLASGEGNLVSTDEALKAFGF